MVCMFLMPYQVVSPKVVLIQTNQLHKKKKQVEGLFMFLQVQQANKKLAEKFGENKEDINGSEV